METTAVKAQRLLEEIANLRNRTKQEPPAGYLDVAGWAKHFGLQRSQTRRHLNQLVKAGKLKSVRLRREVKGRITMITFYG
jgi:predicted ArsR family transcriptional regulator